MYELDLHGLTIKGRYLIQRHVRCGSYTELFRGYDRQTKQLIILKALNVALKGMPDPELEQKLIAYFHREAEVLGRLQHPHIITCLDHDQAIDRNRRTFPYLVIEYMAGGDLMQLCRERPLSLDRALHYVEQVCQGLSYAHHCGIIHRDIKPQNLLLDAQRRVVKISDFGIAKVLQDDQAEVTRGIGTETYAPPECFGFEGPTGELTPAADVYGLAKTLYVMLSGEAPRQFFQQPITSLPSSLSAQPWAEPLLHILNQATQHEPAKRYATITAFQEALNSLRSVVAQPAPQPQDDATVVRGARKPARALDPSIRIALTRPDRVEVSLGSDAPLTTGEALEDARPDRVEVTLRPESAPPGQSEQLGSTGAGSASSPGAVSARRSQPAGWDRHVFMFGVMAGFLGIMFWVHDRVGLGSRRGTQQTAVVMAENLNLRERPTTSSAVRCTIPGGARVEILRESSDGVWLEVETLTCWDVQRQGWRRARGWVSSRYVKRSGG
ncbi:MAG: serine/threonine protein kinase [Acidobacteriota bacterium]|nr:serine/threonine protein kinase [Acidobacteriota bacterium]